VFGFFSLFRWTILLREDRRPSDWGFFLSVPDFFFSLQLFCFFSFNRVLSPRLLRVKISRRPGRRPPFPRNRVTFQSISRFLVPPMQPTVLGRQPIRPFSPKIFFYKGALGFAFFFEGTATFFTFPRRPPRASFGFFKFGPPLSGSTNHTWSSGISLERDTANFFPQQPLGEGGISPALVHSLPPGSVFQLG